MTSSPPSASEDKTNERGFRRFRHHLRPARADFIGGILAGAVYAASSGAGLPVMIKVLLPIFFNKEEEAEPMIVDFSKWLFGEGYQDKLLIVACLGLPVLFMIRGFGAFMNRYLINRAGFTFLDGIRREVFSKLMDLPVEFYQKNKSGDLVNRVMQDSEQLKNAIVNASADIIKQPLTLVSAVGFLIFLSIQNQSALFTLIALVSVPLCVLPVRFAAKRLINRSRQVVSRNGELGAFITEALQSPQEIAAFNLQSSLKEKFRVRIAELFRLSLKTVKYRSFVSPVIEVISACGFVAALYFGVLQGMDFATFSALAVALYMAYEPAKKIGNIHAILKVGKASLERLEMVMDAEDTVPQPEAPSAIPPGPAEVSFEKVTFAYGSGTPALTDVDVRIRPGETVALVGASGAGKSTFVSLIPRFYDPTSGSVRIGGGDVREADKDELRNRIALVPQTPVLFDATVAENIRVGRADATDKEVRQAARAAHISRFIEGLPAQYETLVGERGTTVSGGQRQRIAIARAFLKDAPILILDEATSALDSESEAPSGRRPLRGRQKRTPGCPVYRRQTDNRDRGIQASRYPSRPSRETCSRSQKAPRQSAQRQTATTAACSSR